MFENLYMLLWYVSPFKYDFYYVINIITFTKIPLSWKNEYHIIEKYAR